MCINNIKKKDRIRELIQNNNNLFKCPICSGTMIMNDFGSLTCNLKHNFDLSKKGYLNLLVSGKAPVYSKKLFEARHRVCKTGFYAPLLNKLAQILDEYKKSRDNKKIKILDTGCGEGSHIYSISQRAKENQGNIYVGVDISKDSISIAARNNAHIIWCVADLTRLPFQNKSFDVALNILSPANYGEFDRILNDSGIVIKVVPGSSYLKELREIIYIDKDIPDYSNSKVIDYFKQKLDIEDIQNINYKFDVSEELLPYFIKMTPLTWGKSIEKLNNVYKKNISSITVDLTLIIGIKKR